MSGLTRVLVRITEYEEGIDVSEATVDRSFRGEPLTLEDLSDCFLDAARGFGFQVNAVEIVE